MVMNGRMNNGRMNSSSRNSSRIQPDHSVETGMMQGR